MNTGKEKHHFKLGLTGGMAAGKSTTAAIFAELGCDVWDADQAVHRLYKAEGPAATAIAQLVPHAVYQSRVNRAALRAAIAADSNLLQQIERVVHPLLIADRQDFLSRAAANTVVFDIPLLFETGLEASMDATVCAVAPAEEREKRLAARRATMTPEGVAAVLARQLSDDERIRRADFVIMTDSVPHARLQAREIMKQIKDATGDV